MSFEIQHLAFQEVFHVKETLEGHVLKVRTLLVSMQWKFREEDYRTEKPITRNTGGQCCTHNGDDPYEAHLPHPTLPKSRWRLKTAVVLANYSKFFQLFEK